jgi:actin-related protein
MYSFFRENNVLLGNDAWYCCFQHPDGGLRGSLSLSYPMTYSGTIDDRPGFLLFLEYCVSSLQEQKIEMTEDTQIVLAYKSSYDLNDYRLFSDLFFDKHNLSLMCYLHESILTLVGTQQLMQQQTQQPSVSSSSCLVIDIGSKLTSCIPIYESFVMKHCIQSTRVGGEHLTEFLELLIDAQGIDIYSSQLIRRRQEFSRYLKEKYAFVAPSFDEYIELYGRFTFDYLQVMSNTSPSQPAAAAGVGASEGLRCIQSSRSEKTSEIQIHELFQCNDGSSIDISIDRELFYCTEVLFAPFLHETCQNERSLVEVILSSVDSIDESFRGDICQVIILDGETSQLRGLKKRLEMELSEEMKKRGVMKYQIITNPQRSSTSGSGSQAAMRGDEPQRVRWQGADRFIQSLESSQMNNSVSIPAANIITSHGYEIEGLGLFGDLS